MNWFERLLVCLHLKEKPMPIDFGACLSMPPEPILDQLFGPGATEAWYGDPTKNIFDDWK